MYTKSLLSALCLLCAGVAQSGTLLSVSGEGFLASGIGSGNGEQAAASGFDATTTLSNVSISAPIAALEPTVVFAYLTTSLGGGPSSVLDSTSVLVNTNSSLPYNYNFTSETFFSNLKLGPGNYYLLLAEYDGLNDAGVEYALNGSQVITTSPGVRFAGSFVTAGQGGSYAPNYGGWGSLEQASLFGGDTFITVTGTAATPEPASCGLVGLILICGGLWRRRKSHA